MQKYHIAQKIIPNNMQDKKSNTNNMQDRIVIIGSGQAGAMAAIYLRKKKFAGTIRIFGEEKYLPYQRPPLSKGFLSDETDESKLFLKSEAFYENNNIELNLKTKVLKIDKENKCVLSDSNKKIPYDKLIIATGSSVNFLNSEKQNILYLKTIEDSKIIKNELLTGKTLAIIGGGYIGLELASIAIKKKLKIIILESEKRLMSRVVSERISDFFAKKKRYMGVNIKFNSYVKDIITNGAKKNISCNDGSEFQADLVFAGIGIKPNTQIAEEAGLECNNGIIVNNFGQTSDESIYACGDCTNHPNKILNTRLRLESVHNAVEQSKSVASMILGNPEPYNQVPWFWSDQYNIKLQIAGIFGEYDNCLVTGSKESFSLSFFTDNQLRCVEAVNRPKDFVLGRKIIASGKQFDAKLFETEISDLRDLIT